MTEQTQKNNKAKKQTFDSDHARENEEGKTAEEKHEQPIDRTFPDVQPGSLVRIHQKIKDVDSKGKEKERIQVFEGLVIARKHGREKGATITVRKISEGIGVEKIFPFGLPQITKIEVVKKYKTRRTKLYFTRGHKKKLKEDKRKR